MTTITTITGIAILGIAVIFAFGLLLALPVMWLSLIKRNLK